MKKLILLSLLGLAACADPVVIPVSQPPAPVSIPTVPPMNLGKVQWKVYNLDQLKTLVAELEKTPNATFVIYSLDTQNFESLSLNLSQMREYILGQKEVINFTVGVIQQNSSTDKK